MTKVFYQAPSPQYLTASTKANINMDSSPTPPSRKKFLLLTVAAFCSATILRFVTRKKKDRLYTVKMLTQDGKLVEVDRKLLGPPQKKVSNRELQQWVKKNSEKNKY